MNKFSLILSFILLSGGLFAQSVPVPGSPQELPVILQNGVIHVGNGDVIEGDLLFRDGKIEEVGKVSSTFKQARSIDLKGAHVYPGLISPHTTLGLSEIEAVRATRDFAETGPVNPNVRAIVAYNTDSRVIPTIRSNGILLAQVAPTGGVITGQSSIVQLDAWNWEDAAYLESDGIHMNWPRLDFRTAWWAPPIEKQKERAKKSLDMLEKSMVEARRYQQGRKAGSLEAVDQRWEAMIPVLEKKKPVYIEANSGKQIASALDFVRRHDLKMVLVGGAESDLFAADLKYDKIPVILHKTHDLPRHEDDPIDQAFTLPARLKAEGVDFCLSAGAFWDSRNLPFLAGTAAAYGLSKEEALSAVTLNTAEILGIADRTGSLEKGKDANLVISEGDLLDVRTSKVKMAFIQGRELDLGNKQKDLAKKFGDKAGVEIE